MAIKQRIREERERLGYSQADFAMISGKSLRSQTGWESGRSLPDAEVLAIWADAGADIAYILTGHVTEPIAEDESELLRRYRTAPQALRDGALRLLGAPPSAAPSAGIVTHSEIGQVLQGDLHTPAMTFHVGSGKKGRSE